MTVQKRGQGDKNQLAWHWYSCKWTYLSEMGLFFWWRQLNSTRFTQLEKSLRIKANSLLPMGGASPTYSKIHKSVLVRFLCGMDAIKIFTAWQLLHLVMRGDPLTVYYPSYKSQSTRLDRSIVRNFCIPLLLGVRFFFQLRPLL